jgi:hypothetical protein
VSARTFPAVEVRRRLAGVIRELARTWRPSLADRDEMMGIGLEIAARRWPLWREDMPGSFADSIAWPARQEMTEWLWYERFGCHIPEKALRALRREAEEDDAVLERFYRAPVEDAVPIAGDAPDPEGIVAADERLASLRCALDRAAESDADVELLLEVEVAGEGKTESARRRGLTAKAAQKRRDAAARRLACNPDLQELQVERRPPVAPAERSGRTLPAPRAATAWDTRCEDAPPEPRRDLLDAFAGGRGVPVGAPAAADDDPEPPRSRVFVVDPTRTPPCNLWPRPRRAPSPPVVRHGRRSASLREGGCGLGVSPTAPRALPPSWPPSGARAGPGPAPPALH